MGNIDFVELATYCQNRYKESFKDIKHSRYNKTLFVAILENDTVKCSTTPHILCDAKCCILIHEHLDLAYTNWYEWYKIEFINEEGAVLENKIDDDFVLDTVASGSYANQMLYLEDNLNRYYSCKRPWANHVAKIWELYKRLKETKKENERILIANLFKKDESILELEKQIDNFKFCNELLKQERDQYKELLDSITELTKDRSQL